MFRPRLRPGVLLSLLAASALLAACTTQRPSGSSAMAGMGSMLSVERFLQAANARDYEAMAQLFGTADGPVEGERTEIELRMATIAEILRHEDYQIVSEQRTPGREHPTNRVGVNVTRQGELIRDVGFMVVQTDDGRWFVQEIELDKITGA